MNIKIEQFNSNLKNLINSSQLPVGVVYYLLKYYTKELETTYYDALNAELSSIQSEQNSTPTQEVSEEQSSSQG